MKTFSIVVLVLALSASLLLQGCVSDSTTPITGPQTKVAPAQKATITGKIIDGCTMNAIAGAVVSFGNNGAISSTTSDASGSFAFADVPVGQYQTINGNIVTSGTYNLTASMVSYNKSQTDSTKRYRDYYYQNVTIKFTSVVDSTGLLGLVGSINFVITNLNTKIRGTVVDMNMQPVPNAQVALFDQTVNPGAAIKMTTTDANGLYTFSNVDNGIAVSIVAKSSDGTLQGTLGTFGLPCNIPTDSLRPQFNAEQLMITAVDNVAPYVISITPENNADVSPTGLTVVYRFSEPIKQTAYTRTDLGLGYGTIMDGIHFSYTGLKKTTTDIIVSAAWDPTFTTLTLTPQGLVGSAKYTVDATGAFTSGNLKDAANNAVVNNPNIVGDFEVLNFTTAGGSTIPAAPTLVRRFVPGVYVPLDYTGGTVGFEWNYDANARSYNVYRSINGGSFDLLAS
ncbi:MAG TPA: carboxypeptidase-like regulatory domain-containing protein, partial [Bacteroidota bacterium]